MWLWNGKSKCLRTWGVTMMAEIQNACRAWVKKAHLPLGFVNFNLLFKFQFGKFTMHVFSRVLWERKKQGVTPSLIHGCRRVKHKYKLESTRRRAVSEFIALALRARQKWICKYFITAKKARWSTEDIKTVAKMSFSDKLWLLVTERGFCGFKLYKRSWMFYLVIKAFRVTRVP